MADYDVLDFDRLQGQIATWAARNFPDSGANEQFYGIVEEVGEFTAANEACLWTEWNEDSEEIIAASAAKVEAAEADERDAIGDIAIYLLNFCNYREINVYDVISRAGFANVTIADFQTAAYMQRHDDDFNEPLHLLVMQLGKLAHARLKSRQGIRGSEDEHRAAEVNAVVELFVALALCCSERSYSLEKIASETWAHVARRDWIADPTSGGTSVTNTNGATSGVTS